MSMLLTILVPSTHTPLAGSVEEREERVICAKTQLKSRAAAVFGWLAQVCRGDSLVVVPGRASAGTVQNL
jgi:hypothetical protein